MRPAVQVDPAVRFGQPQIKGVSTEAILGPWLAGDTAEMVCEDYGLTRHEFLVALWFEGTHGRKRHRRLLGEWAEKVAYPVLAGWKKDVDVEDLPLPDGVQRVMFQDRSMPSPPAGNSPAPGASSDTRTKGGHGE